LPVTPPPQPASSAQRSTPVRNRAVAGNVSKGRGRSKG
jgi:hypothetical protein